MLIRFRTLGLALIGCLATAPVLAEGNWNSSVVLSAGYANEKDACSSPVVTNEYYPGATCSERHSVFRIAYDYQFNRIFGFEISYGDLAKAQANGTAYFDGYPGAVENEKQTVGPLLLPEPFQWVADYH